MTAVSSVPPEALATLVHAVDRHRIAYAPQDRDLIVGLCAEAVAFGLEGPHAGRRARSAARLLLELIRPGLDGAALSAISLSCEYAATGA